MDETANGAHQRWRRKSMHIKNPLTDEAASLVGCIFYTAWLKKKILIFFLVFKILVEYSVTQDEIGKYDIKQYSIHWAFFNLLGEMMIRN